MVHRDLIVKAQELYLQNYSLKEISKALEDHVVNEMFWKQEPPDINRRRFYPSTRDIQLFVGRIRKLSKFSDEEQQVIRKVADDIQVENGSANSLLNIEERYANENKSGSSDDEFFEPELENNSQKKKREEKKLQTVLFCYQTPQQQRLLKRYGNQSYLVEIECGVQLKRALTIEMYALLVQTNVDFQVVGCFVVSKQRKDGVTEALNIFKEWNTFWQPKYFLVDYAEKIVAAVTAVFPGKNLLFYV